MFVLSTYMVIEVFGEVTVLPVGFYYLIVLDVVVVKLSRVVWLIMKLGEAFNVVKVLFAFA